VSLEIENRPTIVPSIREEILMRYEEKYEKRIIRSIRGSICIFQNAHMRKKYLDCT
jgi:hypothetical protein